MPRLTFRTGSMVKESKVKLNVTRSLRVAVQVATCRGSGHFVAAALQTAQLVIGFETRLKTCTQSRKNYPNNGNDSQNVA